MNAEFQTIFRALSPYRAATDLNLAVECTPQGSVVQHPVLSESLIITPSGIVAADPASSFVAGDSIDFLASCLNGYPEAIKYILNKYPEVADNPFGLNLAAFADYFAESLELRRRRFLSLVCLRENLASTPHRFGDAMLWLHSKGVEPEAIIYSAYAASGQQLLQIFNDRSFCSESVHFSPCEQYLVFPFFRDYHLHGTVQIVNLAAETDIQTVHLNGGHGFFGLPSCAPGQCVQVFKDVAHCVAAHGFLERNAYNGTGAVSLMTGFRHGQHPRLRDGIFIMGEEACELQQLVLFRQAFEKFGVALGNLTGMDVASAAMPWHDYVRHSLTELLQAEGGLGPQTLVAIDALRPDRAACQHVVDWIAQQNQPDLLARIKSRIGMSQKYQFDRFEIQETPCGYISRKSDSEVGYPITNFILRIDRNLWFLEDRELFHQGQIIMGNQEFPISFPEKAVNSTQLFESLATAAVLRQSQSGPSLPRIIDPAAKKRLSQIISHQVASAPIITGVKRLGWDMHRQKFTTPCWQATALGLTQTSQSGYPGSDLLGHYAFHAPALTLNAKNISPQGRVFISILASLIGRSWAEQPIPAVMVESSKASQYLLRAMFMAFGQVKPIDLTNVQGKVSHRYGMELCGYPIFGQRRSDEPVKTSQTPTFLLNGIGLPYTTPMTDALYSEIYSLTQQVVTQLIVGLLRDGMVLKWEDLPLSVGALVAEGRALIKRYCLVGQFDTFDDDLPLVRAFLSEIPRAQVHEYFHMDPTRDAILLHTRGVGGYARLDLWQELNKRIPGAIMLPAPQRFYISIPAAPMLALLTEFYGAEVKVFFRNQPAEDPDTTMVELPTLPATPKSIDKA